MITLRTVGFSESDVAFRKNAKGNWDLIKYRFGKPVANLTSAQKQNVLKLAHQISAKHQNLHVSKAVLRVNES